MGATLHLDASSEIFTVLWNKYVFNFGGYTHKYDFGGVPPKCSIYWETVQFSGVAYIEIPSFELVSYILTPFEVKLL